MYRSRKLVIFYGLKIYLTQI